MTRQPHLGIVPKISDAIALMFALGMNPRVIRNEDNEFRAIVQLATHSRSRAYHLHDECIQRGWTHTWEPAEGPGRLNVITIAAELDRVIRL